MINRKLEDIQRMVDQYPKVNLRKDYHIGMLIGLARGQCNEIEYLEEKILLLNAEIKELQIKLMEQS
jgi:hypothetical protein